MGVLSALGFGGHTEQTETLPKTSSAVVERIRNILGIRHLESMPVQAARAFQLTSDPSANTSDFVEVIEADEVLSSKIIRIANSVYYFRGKSANDISTAVANIGLDELRCLMSATMLRSLLQGQQASREQIWANSVATGVCARLLSNFCPHISSGEAFLAGLVHDVGKLIMVRKNDQEYQKVLSLVSTEHCSFVEAEEEIFTLNHVEVGKWIAEVWNFPPAVIRAVARHHENIETKEHFKELPNPVTHEELVQLADMMSHAAGIGHPTYFRAYARHCYERLPSLLNHVGISIENLDGFIEMFKGKFEAEYGMYQPNSH